MPDIMYQPSFPPVLLHSNIFSNLFSLQQFFLTSFLLNHWTPFRGHHLILVHLQPYFCSSFPYICTLVTILTLRWRQKILPKCSYLSTKLQSIISKETVIFLEVGSDNFEEQRNTDIARRLVTYAPLSQATFDLAQSGTESEWHVQNIDCCGCLLTSCN
jgi:hypothetical protein